ADWRALEKQRDDLRGDAAGPAVGAALQVFEGARATVGRLGMQSYRGEAVFGHWIWRDPGPDPAAYIEAITDHTAKVLVDAAHIVTLAPLGKLDPLGANEVLAVMFRHENHPTAVVFLEFVITHSPVAHALHQLGGHWEAVSRRFAGEANDKLAAVRN